MLCGVVSLSCVCVCDLLPRGVLHTPSSIQLRSLLSEGGGSTWGNGVHVVCCVV